MDYLYTFAIVAISFGLLFLLRFVWLFKQARRSGLYPTKGKATLFDVRRLLLKKEKNMAIHLYANLFKTNFKDAKKAVEELEKSIQEKNIELD